MLTQSAAFLAGAYPAASYLSGLAGAYWRQRVGRFVTRLTAMPQVHTLDPRLAEDTGLSTYTTTLAMRLTSRPASGRASWTA